MMWVLLILAVIFAAIAYDIVNGVRLPGETAKRSWQAFWAGLFLGPIGLILAMMMRAEILSERHWRNGQ